MHLKELLNLTGALIYSLFLLSWRKTRRVVIYYHGVQRQDIGNFRKQMKYLYEKCSVVKASGIKIVSNTKKKPLVAITFDDALVNVMENAVPILKEYGLHAGIFVPTGNLGQKPRWNIPEGCPDKNEMVMSREQISQLDMEGFEIFSHTMSHPVLTEIEDSELEAELVESKKVLEKILNHEVVAISYPHGVCDSRVCHAAKNAGYRLGFTIEPGMVGYGTDDLMIGRFEVFPDDSLLKFKLKVKGAYQAVKFSRALNKAVLRLIGRCNTK